MHPLLIDWLRRIHLNADIALATKRWKLAEAFLEKIRRKEVVQLLRLFLFPSAATQLIPGLTQQFLEMDKEFPASNNAEDVRLMAGIVMVAAFSQRVLTADGFALGIKSAAFPPQRSKPAQPGIVDEAAKYLAAEADLVRPSDFGTSDKRGEIAKKLEAFAEAVSNDEKELRKKASEELAETLLESFGQHIRRLAEETEVLWWLMGGYSSTLDRET